MGYEFIDPPTSLKRMIRVAGMGGEVFNKLNRAYIYIYIQLLSDQHTQFIV